MQPSTTQRPVMDVTARRPQLQPAAPARPATSLAVHQAPAAEDAAATSSASQPVENTSKPATGHEAAAPSSKAVADTAPASQPETKKKPAPTHAPAAPSATGAIVAAVVVMVALSALAIAVYLKG